MDLKIRVGAAIDRSLSEAFRPLIQAAERAKAATERSSRQAGDGVARGVKRGTDRAEREYQKLVRETEKWQRETDKAAQKAAAARIRASEKASAAEKADFERSEREKTRILQREEAKRQREMAREARANQRIGAGFARDNRSSVGAGFSRAGGMLLGAGRAAGSFALNVVRDVAAGAGVDTDLGSIFAKNSELEKQAAQLSASAYIAGDARNGRRIDKRTLMGEALAVGKDTGMDANAAVEGLSKFVGKTGDLATGREILKDLAIYSSATGASFEDMVDAAGDVSSALGDMPNKGEAIKATMKAIAGQGKLGAVEIKDLASQMAKLAANATQIEGNVTDNIALLGAFAQEARQRGGASSATMAATSVASLINTFKTGARAKEFTAATGKSVFGSTGMLRNPQELVLEALRAKGMDPLGFKKIFANVQGARAVEGFASIYRQAGGGKAGEEAVIAEFERLKKAALADAEVMESFRRSMQTADAQANVFNNSVRESAMKIQDVLIPSLLELAPKFVQLAQTTASIVDWLVGTDARARQTQTRVDTAVGAAGSETKKQLAQGYVFQQQLDVNKEAEKAAFENMNRAKAEAAVLNKSEAYGSGTKMALRAMDYLNPFNAFADKSGGQKMIEANQAKIDERTERAKAAEDKFDEMHKTNLRVADLLENHVIEVRVVDDKTKQPGIPTVDGTGRKPPPEARPR